MRARRAAIVLAIAVAALPRVARGDAPATGTNLHIASASHVKTVGGTELDLPPGYFLDEALHAAVDAEVRRLQDAQTRLAAENASLKASAAAPPGWKPGLYTLAVTFVVGMAAGIYLLHAL